MGKVPLEACVNLLAHASLYQLFALELLRLSFV